MAVNSELTRGVAEPVILSLLNARRMYGYEIIKTVNERTGNAFEWKEGTLYPCLHRLEVAGLIAGEWEFSESGKPRKYYSLTAAGRAELAKKVDEWRVFAKAMDVLLLA